MRNLFIVIIICFVFVACKKSNGNSAPEIKFKSITNFFGKDYSNTPILTIQISDLDGDLGFKDGKDTSYIFVKNLTIGPNNRADSFKLPASLSQLPTGTFTRFVDVDIDLNGLGAGRALAYTNKTAPSRDSIYYEIYVKDFGKNKSNVIKTGEPLILIQK